jgi:hypothetical protein
MWSVECKIGKAGATVFVAWHYRANADQQLFVLTILKGMIAS